MVDLVLASCTLRPRDKGHNLSRMESVIASNPCQHPSLFVFPECNIIGGLWPDGYIDYANLAEEIPNGPSCQRAMEMARWYDTTICAGLIEKSDGQFFITHFICNSQGYQGCQRKIFPQNPEKKQFFYEGETLHAFHLFGHNLCILACADFLFPETTILVALADVSLILSPTDCFHVNQIETVKRLLCAKAMGTGAPIAAVFGSNESSVNDEVLAAFATDPNGDFLIEETRLSDEDKIIHLPINLQSPKQKWGGARRRAKALLQVLENTFH